MTMKTVKQFALGTLTLFFIQACSDSKGTVTADQGSNMIDTINMGCLGTYELDFQGSGDTINKIYGEDHIKHGRWVTYALNLSKEKPTTDNAKTIRIKTEEGYYRNNKKVGFWKFYNEDGTLKDSIEYKSDVPL